MQLPTFMQKISKRAYAITALAVATIAVPATLLAWGPAARVTFTLAHPAEYVTFNSITDNKQYGDERNFVQIRSVTDNTKFGENATLTPGKEYEVFAYYHNNGDTDLNASGATVATGAFMRAQMPATVNAGENARVTVFVGATNAKHLDAAGTNLGNQVWDEAFAKNSTNGTVALRYVPGSAKITSNGAVNGKSMPDTLYTTGAALGYDALDGKLPGCLQYSGYVTYRFKVDQPNFTMEKQVARSDEATFKETTTAKVGDIVDFKLHYKNTGTTQQDGVIIRDQLPAGLEYVANSTYVSTTGTWVKTAHETVTKQGINVGSYGPNGGAYVKFSAKVVADKLVCGTNTIKNIASADTQNGSKSDDATVTVTKECTTPEKVEACNLDTKKIETVEKSKIDNVHYTLDLSKCKEVAVKEITVCRLSDKKYPVTIKESEFDSAKHSKNPDDCKTTPVTPEIPTELPKTGIAEGLMSIVGLGSLVASTSYYIASRRMQS